MVVAPFLVRHLVRVAASLVHAHVDVLIIAELVGRRGVVLVNAGAPALRKRGRRRRRIAGLGRLGLGGLGVGGLGLGGLGVGGFGLVGLGLGGLGLGGFNLGGLGPGGGLRLR